MILTSFPFSIVIYSMEFFSTHTILSSRASHVLPVAVRLEYKAASELDIVLELGPDIGTVTMSSL